MKEISRKNHEGDNLLDEFPAEFGNQIDGLPPARHDKLVTNFARVDKVLLDDLQETQRKPCGAYVEDQYGCDKI